MTTAVNIDGTQNATNLPSSSSIAQTPPTSIADTLNAIENLMPDQPLAMLRTTARHISEFRQTPLDQLAIEALSELGSGFSAYLRERKYSRNTIRSYHNYSKVLLHNAQGLGWTPSRHSVNSEWEPIRDLFKQLNQSLIIVDFAIEQRKAPKDFTDADINDWATRSISSGVGYNYTQAYKRNFRCTLFDSGLNTLLPGVSRPPIRPARYSIKLSEMPDLLRMEIDALLKWKQDLFAPGRPKHSRHRPVTAKRLKEILVRIYGFAVRIAGRTNIDSIALLVAEDVLTEYVAWGLNERGWDGTSLSSELGMLYAAVRHNPTLTSHDFSWFGRLVSGLPLRPESEKLGRKERKYVAFDELAKIPNRIRERNPYASKRK